MIIWNDNTEINENEGKENSKHSKDTQHVDNEKVNG